MKFKQERTSLQRRADAITEVRADEYKPIFLPEDRKRIRDWLDTRQGGHASLAYNIALMRWLEPRRLKRFVVEGIIEGYPDLVSTHEDNCSTFKDDGFDSAIWGLIDAYFQLLLADPARRDLLTDLPKIRNMTQMALEQTMQHFPQSMLKFLVVYPEQTRALITDEVWDRWITELQRLQTSAAGAPRSSDKAVLLQFMAAVRLAAPDRFAAFGLPVDDLDSLIQPTRETVIAHPDQYTSYMSLLWSAAVLQAPVVRLTEEKGVELWSAQQVGVTPPLPQRPLV